MRLPLAVAFAMLATPALAQVSTCGEYNALDASAKESTVMALMEAQPILFNAERPSNDTTGANPASASPESRVSNRAIIAEITEICAGDANKTLVEAAREENIGTD